MACFETMNYTAFLRGVTLTRPFLLPGLLSAGFMMKAVQAGTENDIPQAYPVERYEPVWKKSPFTLSSAADAVVAGGSSDRLKLTGVLKIGEQPYVSLYDSESKERFLVTSETNSRGIRLESVQTSDDLSKVTVALTLNGEPVKLHYDMEYLKQTAVQAAGAAPPVPAPVAANPGAVVIRPSNATPTPSGTSQPPPTMRPPIHRRIIIPSQSTGS